MPTILEITDADLYGAVINEIDLAFPEEEATKDSITLIQHVAGKSPTAQGIAGILTADILILNRV